MTTKSRLLTSEVVRAIWNSDHLIRGALSHGNEQKIFNWRKVMGERIQSISILIMVSVMVIAQRYVCITVNRYRNWSNSRLLRQVEKF